LKNRTDNKAGAWEEVARNWEVAGYSNQLLAEHKRKVYLDLIEKWFRIQEHQTILKTDLFTEAFGVEQFSFCLPHASLIGIDISFEIVKRAKHLAPEYGLDAGRFFCCDVRQIPLREHSIDLVISDSSLDHFPEEIDLIDSLRELSRVLKIGGVLIITLDNRNNLTYMPYFLVRLWMKLGFAPYFIGRTLSLTKLKKTLEDTGLLVEESTAIFHYPHPDFLVRGLERTLSRVSFHKLDNAIRKSLSILDRLGSRPTKYLTGRYIAVKAIKYK